jgi:uncharacterized membrane protein
MIGKLVVSGVWTLVAASFAFLPIVKGADAFFGVPVSEEFVGGPEARRYLRTYWLLLLPLMGASIAGIWLLPSMTTAAVLLDVGLLGALVAIDVTLRLVRRHQVISPEDPVAAFVRPRDRWHYVNWPLEGLCMALIVAAWGYFAAVYGSLPARLVDASGGLTPIGWKGIGVQLALQVYVFVLFLLMLVGMARSAVRLPANASDDYLAVRDRYMRTMARMFYAMKVTMIGSFGAVAVLVLRAAATGGDRDIAIAVVAPIVAYWTIASGAVAYYAVRMYRLRAQMRALAGPGSLERAADHGGWVAGLVYANPQDPSVWVEKRVGIGYTVNLARWEGWLLLAVFICPMFLCLWLLLR